MVVDIRACSAKGMGEIPSAITGNGDGFDLQCGEAETAFETRWHIGDEFRMGTGWVPDRVMTSPKVPMTDDFQNRSVTLSGRPLGILGTG